MTNWNKEILLKIVKEGLVSQKELRKEFSLTDRQINYAINNINVDLKARNLPSIVLKNKTYSTKRDLTSQIINNVKETKKRFFPPEERCILMVIMILSRTGPVYLNDFIATLNISKNTALADLKKLKINLKKANVKIVFSRKTGYTIIGSEWDKRITLYQNYLKLYAEFNFEDYIFWNANAVNNYADVKKDLVNIESKLCRKFTDDAFFVLARFLSTVLYRIEQGKLLKNKELLSDEEIKQTKEYTALQNTIFANLVPQEKSFVALFILGANIKRQEAITVSMQTQLTNALWEFLNEFELKSFIVLPDKKNLLKKLMDHFRPAYFRIKYKLPEINPMFAEIIDKYRNLYEFVLQSIGPLNKFFGTTISADEVAYVTIFIGGHLVQNKTNEFKRKVARAIPVCPNGISASKLLESNLRVAFPELSFYPACSVREYQHFVLPYDLVFATVPLKSTKTVFIVNEILNERSIAQLRNDVFKKLFNLNFANVDIQKVISTVGRFAEIKDKRGLENGIAQLLIPESNLSEWEIHSNNNANVYKKLILVKQSMPWNKILEKIVMPAIQDQVVRNDFWFELKKEYLKQPKYILLNRKIALLHLNPDLFKQKLGLIFLISKNGLEYAGYKIHLVALLTTPNKTDQLQLLYKLKHIAEDEAFIKELIQVSSSEEAVEKIKNYNH